MNRRNYQLELDRILLENEGRHPRLLLHSCCGPCSSSVLEYLTQYFEITLLWYNPNLYPGEEYCKRLSALEKLLEGMQLTEQVTLLIEPWESEAYYDAVKGLEEEPEGGARCTECFRLRLTRTAQIAAERGFDYFCTTLTLSRHKDAVRINRLGEEAAEFFDVNWLPSDFKKQGREMRSAKLAEMYGIYRQMYCGCEFSMNKRKINQ